MGRCRDTEGKKKKRAHLKHAGSIRKMGSGVEVVLILSTRTTGILPASTLFSCPSCFTAVSPFAGKCLARRVMISHCRILPKLSQFVGSAGLVGNQHRLSLKEQLGLFTEPSCDVMKPDKQVIFPVCSSCPVDILI